MGQNEGLEERGALGSGFQRAETLEVQNGEGGGSLQHGQKTDKATPEGKKEGSDKPTLADSHIRLGAALHPAGRELEGRSHFLEMGGHGIPRQ